MSAPSFGIPTEAELAEIEEIFQRGGSMLSFPMQHSGQWLLAEVHRLRHEVMRLENAVDLERRLKVAARKDADEVRAEVQHNLDHPWPPPRARS